MSDVPRGCIVHGPEVPLIGGPHDGAARHYEIILPFLGGGVPSSVLVLGEHYYQLKDDRSAWEYRGVMKEKA